MKEETVVKVIEVGKTATEIGSTLLVVRVLNRVIDQLVPKPETRLERVLTGMGSSLIVGTLAGIIGAAIKADLDAVTKPYESALIEKATFKKVTEVLEKATREGDAEMANAAKEALESMVDFRKNPHYTDEARFNIASDILSHLEEI